MAGDRTLEILGQIEALVSDKLQIVSYKWLSRDFAVSSNYAKRLLQEFVEKHATELEVLYTLSGWLKNSPQTYGIRLASGHNLSEVKQEFKDGCSVQVYSVQASIPKDLAVLWSTEFVQAEELFNQPTDAENCLRDNRFCGVSNSFVKRIVDGKSFSVAPLPPKVNPVPDLQSKSKSMTKDPPFQPSRREQIVESLAKIAVQSCSATTLSEKSDSVAQKGADQTNKPHVVKESVAVVNKRKKQNEKPSSGSGGSLASLWGRASAKPRPSSSAKNSDDSPNAAHPTEAQAVHESEDAASSDDDAQNMNFRRDSNGAGIRKRRVVMDFSDEDNEEDNVACLASPDPPNAQLGLVHNTENFVAEKKNLTFKEDKSDALGGRQANAKEKTSGLPSDDDDGRNKSKGTNAGITLHKKTQIPEGLADQSKRDKAAVSTSTSPKRRKVLKTRIDERGREVTEVVWEGEVADTVSTDNNMSIADSGIRAPASNKAAAAATAPASNAPAKLPSKPANNKPAKGAAKNTPKQGNIMSFFKKV